ncbi:hypothetical protein SYNPS1DRAFT_26506 [Syncephalis pseudoplumigaleata]|uniref:RGS domain-containing protein n=1 Tax=Syncephalis pseudoplumigaleata TaxID=1712513 RepID=A0A4P9Z5Q7_9FUNG|nr:hypothetical protein SYNPS1DRAFT_26506 [Syncephalis pseudoplumigaleata]|eukprot:RKP27865.1 hypothetical protein SYNPS1DRAFT_26506 [Syncephalis pseudoplumigaleata]
MSEITASPIEDYDHGPLYYILCGVFNTMFVVDIAFFLYFARTEPALRYRGRFISVMHVLGAIIYTTNVFISLPRRGSYSCPLYYFMANLGLAVWATSMILRFWRLMWVAEFQRHLFEKEQRKKLELRRGSTGTTQLTQQSTLRLPMVSLSTGELPNARDDGQPTDMQRLTCAIRLGTICMGQDGSSPPMSRRPTPTNILLTPIRELPQNHIGSSIMPPRVVRPWWDVLLRRRRIITEPVPVLTQPLRHSNPVRSVMHYIAKWRILQPRFHQYVLLVIVLFVTIMSVCVILVVPAFMREPHVHLQICTRAWPFHVLNIASGSLFLVLLPLISIIVWNTTDVYGIRNEVLLQSLIGYGCVLPFLLLRYVDGPGWVHARETFPIYVLPEILVIFSHVMSITWPMLFLKYERRVLARHRRKATIALANVIRKSTDTNVSEFEAYLEALDYPEIQTAVSVSGRCKPRNAANRNDCFAVQLHEYSVRDFTVENLAFARRLRYMDQILRHNRSESYAPYYGTLYSQGRRTVLPGS